MFQQPRLLLPAGLADWEINFIKGLVSSITVFHGRDQGPNYKNEDPLNENMYTIVEVMYNANGAKFLLLCNERTAYPQIYVFVPLQEEVGLYVNIQYVINPLFSSS